MLIGDSTRPETRKTVSQSRRLTEADIAIALDISNELIDSLEDSPVLLLSPEIVLPGSLCPLDAHESDLNEWMNDTRTAVQLLNGVEQSTSILRRTKQVCSLPQGLIVSERDNDDRVMTSPRYHRFLTIIHDIIKDLGVMGTRVAIRHRLHTLSRAYKILYINSLFSS